MIDVCELYVAPEARCGEEAGLFTARPPRAPLWTTTRPLLPHDPPTGVRVVSFPFMESLCDHSLLDQVGDRSSGPQGSSWAAACELEKKI